MSSYADESWPLVEHKKDSPKPLYEYPRWEPKIKNGKVDEIPIELQAAALWIARERLWRLQTLDRLAFLKIRSESKWVQEDKSAFVPTLIKTRDALQTAYTQGRINHSELTWALSYLFYLFDGEQKAMTNFLGLDRETLEALANAVLLTLEEFFQDCRECAELRTSYHLRSILFEDEFNSRWSPVHIEALDTQKGKSVTFSRQPALMTEGAK